MNNWMAIPLYYLRHVGGMLFKWWNVNIHTKYRVDKVLDEVSIMYGYGNLHDHNCLLFN